MNEDLQVLFSVDKNKRIELVKHYTELQTHIREILNAENKELLDFFGIVDFFNENSKVLAPNLPETYRSGFMNIFGNLPKLVQDVRKHHQSLMNKLKLKLDPSRRQTLMDQYFTSFMLSPNTDTGI